MTKLLRAGIRRYIKSSIFWITLAGLMLLGILGAAENGPQASSDDLYLIGFMILLSAMIALSIGREFGHGAMRNKLVTGYTKSQLFLVEWLLATVLCVLLFLVSALPFLILNYPILKTIPTEALVKSVVGLFLGTLVVITACVTICCLIHRRAVSVVVVLLFIIGLLFLSIYIYDQLERPEYLDIYISNGALLEESSKPNPAYISGFRREVYLFLHHINPFGQIIEYANILSPYFTPHVVKLSIPEEEMRILNTAPVYSLGAMIAAVCCGYGFFRKKNIK